MKAIFAPAQPPTHRPPWLVVLSLLMLLHGGIWLVGAVTNLRDPKLLATLSFAGATETADQVEVHRKITNVTQGILLGHQTQIRGVAVAAIGLALLLLYTVAAILARDKNGRSLALSTAWLILGYHLATLPIFIRIARDHATQTAPLYAQILAPQPADQPAVLRGLTSVILGEPYAVSAFGVGWALLLLGYFGGRRGRALYGIGRPLAPQRTPASRGT